MFSRKWSWMVLSSVMWYSAVWLKFTDVSKEGITSIFMIEEWTKRQRLITCLAYSSPLKMEAIRSSEMTSNVYSTTRRNIPECPSLSVVGLTRKGTTDNTALFGAQETGHSCSTLLFNLLYWLAFNLFSHYAQFPAHCHDVIISFRCINLPWLLVYPGLWVCDQFLVSFLDFVIRNSSEWR